MANSGPDPHMMHTGIVPIVSVFSLLSENSQKTDVF